MPELDNVPGLIGGTVHWIRCNARVADVSGATVFSYCYQQLGPVPPAGISLDRHLVRHTGPFKPVPGNEGIRLVNSASSRIGTRLTPLRFEVPEHRVVVPLVWLEFPTLNVQGSLLFAPDHGPLVVPTIKLLLSGG